ncbi:MAG: glycoside hydrolase family 3 C-terminal domain-containing protein, partial [Bacteroidales bacterium]|nr:glycoside hydrolase family 3 C-terminal domain-containing protein [Bacteroidales bacterium]
TEWDSLPDSLVEGAAHRALSLKMAEETLVLLQNRGGVLPLSPDARIALVGPNAEDREMMWGNYNPIPEHTVTLADALRERIPGIPVLEGCPLVGPAAPVASLLKALEGIDVVVFAGGISPRLEGEEMPVDVPGFRGGDRTSLELPSVQRELLAALHQAGKKVVLVNFSGSAMGLEPETQSCDAILQAWYPGEEGGTAIAEVLLGEVSPSGKLPLTFYRNVEQLPDFEDYNMRGRTYRFFKGDPLFPFGFGLSYTSFEYGSAAVRGRKLIVPVTNAGSVDAAEEVQLYVRRPEDAEGPLKTLRGFRRVFIPAGQTVNVSFNLSDETFEWWSEEDQNMVPLRGMWELLYGGSSEDFQCAYFEL